MTKLTYDEKDITGFKRDLDKIRAKPTMYLGALNDDGRFTLFRECADNCVDEARAGRNDFVGVSVDKDGSLWVFDHGQGIPVGMHKTMNISTLTHVLTNLQSSGKMEVGKAYKASIGAHGCGLKGVNAVSELFEVWTYRKADGGWHYTRFEDSHEVQKVKKTKDAPKVPGFGTRDSGTVFHFKHSPKFFGKSKLNLKDVAQWAKMTSYMNAGLLIHLKADGKERKWRAKDGVKSYLADRIDAIKATPFSKKYVFHNSGTLELALAFTDVEGPQVEFFTNTVRNADGGVHADDVYRALFNSLKPYVKVKPEKKAKKAKKGKTSHGEGKYPFTDADIRDGLLGLVNAKIDAPQFDSQVKTKLVDTRVKGACYEEALKVFEAFWSDNKKMATDLIQRASLLRSKTADFLKDKNLIKNVNAAAKKIDSKLAGIVGKTPVEDRELFTVEGDSAGGGMIRARNKSFQAIYPCKGKPLNVHGSTKDQVNKNAEVCGLLAALGVDLRENRKGDPTINYGKVIMMADPDVDGKHINTLWAGLLWAYTPWLVKQGKVYAVRAPLYKCKYKGEVHYAMTKEAVYKKTGTDKVDITYVKGWGEVNEEDLIHVALNPETRVLYRLTAPDAKEAAEFSQMLGKKPQYRRAMFGFADDENQGQQNEAK